MQADVSNSRADTATARLQFGFPDIEWELLKSIYGWPALQYQAWARGFLEVDGEQTLILYTDGVLEFWLNDKPYFGGDFYAYRNSPFVLSLESGHHKLDLRLIRDVRAFGANEEPLVKIELHAETSKDGLAADAGKLLIADIVDGMLSSPYASIPVRNETQSWINVTSIESVEVAFDLCSSVLSNFESKENFATSMTQKAPLRIAPGQTRPLNFNVSYEGKSSTLCMVINYGSETSSKIHGSKFVAYLLACRTMSDSHKMTFLRASNTVSYAILRPPSKKALKEAQDRETWPVMINLHGAGIEADSDQVRTTFDSIPDLRCWVVSPSGTTSWSGDDWRKSFNNPTEGVSPSISCESDAGQGSLPNATVRRGHS